MITFRQYVQYFYFSHSGSSVVNVIFDLAKERFPRTVYGFLIIFQKFLYQREIKLPSIIQCCSFGRESLEFLGIFFFCRYSLQRIISFRRSSYFRPKTGFHPKMYALLLSYFRSLSKSKKCDSFSAEIRPLSSYIYVRCIKFTVFSYLHQPKLRPWEKLWLEETLWARNDRTRFHRNTI